MKIRVLLADDHTIVRESLRIALHEAEDMEVVGEATTGREALHMTEELGPDVVIIDIGMPDLNGIDATGRIIGSNPDVRVIALSAHTERQLVTSMLDAGASGYLLKDSPLSELVHAVRAVHHGKKYLSPDVLPDILDPASSGELPAQLSVYSVLGRREREVLQLLAEGQTSKQIARTLYISPGTVETHRRNIMRKLDLHSVAELTRYAIREGLTQP